MSTLVLMKTEPPRQTYTLASGIHQLTRGSVIWGNNAMIVPEIPYHLHAGFLQQRHVGFDET